MLSLPGVSSQKLITYPPQTNEQSSSKALIPHSGVQFLKQYLHREDTAKADKFIANPPISSSLLTTLQQKSPRIIHGWQLNKLSGDFMTRLQQWPLQKPERDFLQTLDRLSLKGKLGITGANKVSPPAIPDNPPASKLPKGVQRIDYDGSDAYPLYHEEAQKLQNILNQTTAPHPVVNYTPEVSKRVLRALSEKVQEPIFSIDCAKALNDEDLFDFLREEKGKFLSNRGSTPKDASIAREKTKQSLLEELHQAVAKGKDPAALLTKLKSMEEQSQSKKTSQAKPLIIYLHKASPKSLQALAKQDIPADLADCRFIVNVNINDFPPSRPSPMPPPPTGIKSTPSMTYADWHEAVRDSYNFTKMKKLRLDEDVYALELMNSNGFKKFQKKSDLFIPMPLLARMIDHLQTRKKMKEEESEANNPFHFIMKPIPVVSTNTAQYLKEVEALQTAMLSEKELKDELKDVQTFLTEFRKKAPQSDSPETRDNAEIEAIKTFLIERSTKLTGKKPTDINAFLDSKSGFTEIPGKYVISKKELTKYLDKAHPLPKNDAIYEVDETTPRLSELNGEAYQTILKNYVEPVALQMRYPDLMSKLDEQNPHLGKKPLILHHGVPGTGKTYGARAYAGEFHHLTNLPACVIPVDVSAFHKSGYIGSGAKSIDAVFELAEKQAKQYVKQGGGHIVLFFDELDSLANRQNKQGDSGSREQETTTNHMLTKLDGFNNNAKKFPNVKLHIIGATNLPDSLDKGLADRVTMRVEHQLPKEAKRHAVLKQMLDQFSLKATPSLVSEMARETDGFNERTLGKLVDAMRRKVLTPERIESLEKLRAGSPEIDRAKLYSPVTREHFLEAKQIVKEEEDKGWLRSYT